MTIRLTDPEADRYQRFRLIRWWDQEKLHNARILVVGAGALGNEVVKNLALLGVGNIWVADFDAIETTNLTRSALFRPGDVGRWKADVLAERAGEMNADCKIVAIKGDVRYDLGFQFLSGIDLVFGCLDNREARYHINRSCYLLRKRYIDGGLDTLNGSVTFFHPPGTACYECTLSSVDRAELQKRISCLKSLDPEIKHHVPTAPTIASIIGGMMVQIGVRALHGLDAPEGKRLGLYGLSDVFFDIKLDVSDDCGLHAAVDPLPATIESLESKQTASLKEILEEAKQKWNSENIAWDFDRDLIVGLNCMSCGKRSEFVGTHSLFQGSGACECGGPFKPEIASQYTGSEPWGGKSLLQLGFPADHVYCATSLSGEVYFTLSM